MKNSMMICTGGLLLGLGGCDVGPGQQPPVARTGIRLPAHICDRSRAAMEKLQKSAGVDVEQPGTATVTEAAWLPMAAESRNQLAQLIAFDAACRASGPLAEVDVTIRNEGGRILTQRIVPVTEGMDALLADSE